MANTGETIGVNYPTLMPDLTDIADIQQAYQMYHIGIANWDGITPPASNSIEGHFSSVNAKVVELEGRPIAGGEVSTTEPTEIGTPPQSIPEGYIWVDPSTSAESILDFPTVIYSPTDISSSLTMSDVGTMWVNENGGTDYKPINVWNGTQWIKVATQITTITTNTQSNSYTLVASDAGKTIEMNSASANTLTIPPNSSVNFPVGTLINVVQYGAGQTTITAGLGVTLRSNGAKLKISGQYSSARFYQKTTDEWIVLGDLSA